MRADFDKQAMEHKIANNKARGFSEHEILLLLLQEQRDNLNRILLIEQRNLELQDQIEYMRSRQ